VDPHLLAVGGIPLEVMPANRHAGAVRKPALQRDRPVSRFCRPKLEADNFVLCVQLRAAGERLLADQSIDAIVERLRELRLLSLASSVSDHSVAIYAYRTIPEVGLRRIERFAAGRVIAVRTTDFADGFRQAAEQNGREAQSA